jgi:hypothetical protein
MSEFSELIKRFDKIRDYMRDFYVYGFKSRVDFNRKSARTYDNEKRRCESYLKKYMKWDYKDGNKASFISVDSSKIPINPFFAAWKSKSFTSNDIILHFYILDALKNKKMTVDLLTDYICEKSGITFDTQTVRGKCNEYVDHGMLTCEKQGKAFFYGITPEAVNITPELLDAVKFFQGVAPIGVVGSFILDNENIENNLFAYKHHYIAHTLEDGILLDLLTVIRKNQSVVFENQSERSGKTTTIHALPLKIFISATTGRRYVCMYSLRKRRFFNYRLDYIKSVIPDEVIDSAPELREKLGNNLDKVWGVSFGGEHHAEVICMKLRIDEKHEQYITHRILREGQGGELTRLGTNTFIYTKEIFDSSDMSPWIKTFTGRILALEGTNELVIKRFYNDINQMAEMYSIGGEQ